MTKKENEGNYNVLRVSNFFAENTFKVTPNYLEVPYEFMERHICNL